MRGDLIVSLRRISYVLDGQRQDDGGPIELTGANSGPWLLDVAGDGEALCVERRAWSDPFAGVKNQWNDSWSAQFGTLQPCDVGDPLANLVDCYVQQVELVRVQSHDPASKVIGARLLFQQAELCVLVAFDELDVSYILS